MGVQKKILKRTEEFEIQVDGVTKTFSCGTGVLIGGTPGQIYDVAYGPVVHTTTLAAAADIGSFVANQGVIVNAPEYALYGTLRDASGEGGPLAPSLTLPTGSVVSCMTAGHVWIQRKNLNAILEGMFARIIWQQPVEDTGSDTDAIEAAHANDLMVVEVNGLRPYDEGGSTANG